MTRLSVATAQFRYAGPDRVDITRQGGSVFGPSWPLLREAKMRMVENEPAAWDWYVPIYLDEMRRSYRDYRLEWGALLASPRVVLVCYCARPGHCHRSLLAGILAKLGATLEGELPC